MKKIAMLLVSTLIFGSLYAADCKSTNVVIPTTEFNNNNAQPEDYYCGTSSYTITGVCWQATSEVTVCGDFESQAEANIIASLIAKKDKKLLIAITVFMDEMLSCS